MSEQFDQVRELLIGMVMNMTSSAVEFLPKLVGALMVMLVGWIFARIVRTVVHRSIRGGLDTLLERTGAAQVLERSSMTAAPSEILAGLLFWLIMIMFVMGAAEIIGLTALTNAIARIFGYIPAVISASLVLAAGVFLARFAGNVVTSGATAADLSYAAGLGAVANTSILVMVGVVTMEQLGVDTQILMTVITVSVAAIMAGMGLAFALGARDVVRGILAGHYLRQFLPQGQAVEVGGERGVIEQIGPLATTFRDGERCWSVPNNRLIEEVIQH